MTMTVTTINYSDIDMAIFEECFNDTLPYLDRDPPNIIWEEGGLTASASTGCEAPEAPLKGSLRSSYLKPKRSSPLM